MADEYDQDIVDLEEKLIEEITNFSESEQLENYIAAKAHNKFSDEDRVRHAFNLNACEVVSLHSKLQEMAHDAKVIFDTFDDETEDVVIDFIEKVKTLTDEEYSDVSAFIDKVFAAEAIENAVTRKQHPFSQKP